MLPRIKVNVGRGYDPVELQQLIDTDLQTINKTVVGAINELLDKVENIDPSTSFNPTNGALLETITQEKVDQWNSAQENTIEKIFVNNSEVSIIDKSVSMNIPTKASDIGAASSDHDHDGVYLKTTEPIPAALLPTTFVGLGETAETAFRGDLGKIAYDHAMSEHAPSTAQENVIEVFKMVDTDLPIISKTVTIPIASSSSYGVVKSSTGVNKIAVSEDGTMQVGSISVSNLVVPDGEEFVLNGGSSTVSA